MVNKGECPMSLHGAVGLVRTAVLDPVVILGEDQALAADQLAVLEGGATVAPIAPEVHRYRIVKVRDVLVRVDLPYPLLGKAPSSNSVKI